MYQSGKFGLVKRKPPQSPRVLILKDEMRREMAYKHCLQQNTWFAM